MLVDGKGDRLDKGPTTIVTDSKRPDKSVINGISCMSCHVRGIIDKTDQIRDHVEKNDVRFKKAERESVFALYPAKGRFAATLKEDGERFLKALRETGCKEGSTEPVVALTLRFEGEMDIALAAAESGMKVQEFKRKVDRSEKLSRTIGASNVEGGTVQRDVFTEAFKDIVREFELGTLLSQVNKVVPKEAKEKGVEASKEAKKHPQKANAWGHSNLVLSVAFSRDGKSIFSASHDNTIRLWEVSSGKQLKEFRGHTKGVNILALNADGSRFLSGSYDATVRFWDVGTEKEILSLTGSHKNEIWSVAISADEKCAGFFVRRRSESGPLGLETKTSCSRI